MNTIIMGGVNCICHILPIFGWIFCLEKKTAQGKSFKFHNAHIII